MANIKLTFRIHYNTQWGDKMKIVGNLPQVSAESGNEGVSMHWEGDGFWRFSISADSQSEIKYHYILLLSDGTKVVEFGERNLLLKGLAGEVIVADTWLHHTNAHHPFFSSAFSGTIFRRDHEFKIVPATKSNVRINIRAPRVPQNLTLCISGNIDALGNWDARKPYLMDNTTFPTWTSDFFCDFEDIEYKFGYYDLLKKEIVQWEEGENRLLELSDQHEVTIQNDENLRIYTPWRGAGFAVPVFSIRSEASMGCGEFHDIKALTDWSVKVGMKILQILPINDTMSTNTWQDSYPYNAISVNALHPIYLHIPALFKKTQTKVLKEIREKSEELNAFDYVNYEEVLKAKLYFSRLAFEKQKETLREDAAFLQFSAKNKQWLASYTAFAALRDKFGTADFHEWPGYVKYNPATIKKLEAEDSAFAEDVLYYAYLQFKLDQQLTEAVLYARKNSVVVKGDIPIGINRNGVEAWQEPHLFNFNQQAGAPPDDFAINGQNWGFPTYNWDVMEKEGFKWWEDRFKKMKDYFDAYRIDHILGFFRIWEIPLDYKEGLMGHFNPSLPVSEDELRSYGVEFDFERFCKPYISHEHIYQQFGDNAPQIIETFLNEIDNRLYFKNEFDKEEKLIAYFDLLPEKHPLKNYKDALRFYYYEVLLIPDRNAGYFHPRISMHYSRSYQHLPTHQQQALNSLYVMYYYHRHNDFWGYEGHRKLEKLVNATDMLVCGEDLGMVPACVDGVMNDLQILSLEVQRMPKDSNIEVGNPYDYPYMSVCTPATHDMSTIRGWWEEDRNTSQKYYNGFLQKWGEAPEKCDPWLNEEIVKHQLNARSMITVLSIQDWLNCTNSTINPCDPEDERINIPKNPRHYWKYRMHLSVEQIMENEEFNERVKALVKQSGRG